MNVKRLLWESDNGKYRVLVRHFEGDPGPLVGYWMIKSNGKSVSVKYSSLPEYVQEKIENMKSQVIFHG